MAGVLETGAANAETIQAAFAALGIEGTPTEAVGKLAEVYEATEKYGGAFWDAAGGDYSTILNMGQNMGGLYAINATFGEGFAGNTPQQAIGSKIGQAAGTAVAGPFGAIVGGMMGAILGAGIGSILGLDTKPDYDFVTRSGSGGFEGNKYITTPFGNFGFNSGSTRDLSMSKQGSSMLDMYAKAIVPMDVAMASVMTKDEVGAIKGYLNENTLKNSHVYSHGDVLKNMTQGRLKAIDATMSEQRKLDTGFAEMVNQWNEGIAGGYDSETYKNDPKYASMVNILGREGKISRISYDNVFGTSSRSDEGDFLIRSTVAEGFGERTVTYNMSQAINDGNFNEFEQKVMSDAMQSYMSYRDSGSGGSLSTGPSTLQGFLDKSMAGAISDDQRYTV